MRCSLASMTTERIRSKFGWSNDQLSAFSLNPIKLESTRMTVLISFSGEESLRYLYELRKEALFARTASRKRKQKKTKNKIARSQERRCRGMPARMRSFLAILVGLALLSDSMCQAQGNHQLSQENTTHDAQQQLVHGQHNQGIRRNGMLGSTRGRHYTRGRRLRGAAAAVVDTAVTDIPDRHFVLTADKRQSSWRASIFT